MNTVRDAIFLADIDTGMIVDANHAAEVLCGRSLAELLLFHHTQLYPPEEVESARRGFEKDTRVPGLTEGMVLHKDGRRIPVEIASSHYTAPDGKRTLVVFRDVTERKRAEAALRESEERFQNMANTAPVMIWISGPDKLGTFFNNGWLDFTGRSMDQELGNGWATGVHPGDVDRCLATYSSSFDARRRFQMEYRLRRADGEYRWVLDNALPHYQEGEFAGYIGACIDVTEQKLVEERLRANEVLLNHAQRLAKVGSFERQINADTTRWSDEMFRIFGLPSTPPNLQALLSHVHPADREKIVEVSHEVRSGTGTFDTEHRIIRPDGEVRFVRSIVEAIKGDQGAPTRIVGAIQDVTEQTKARELLGESEESLKIAQRLAHIGNWHWDIKANRVTGSEEMFRIFGKPPDFIPTYEQFLRDIVPQDRGRVEREIRECLEGKSGYSTEYQTALPNGDLRTISAITEVVRDEDGSPMHMYGACQDITDSRRAQEEAFARQKLESVGTLANGIAHDFNNLLGVVLAQADLALDELAGGAHPEEELQGIREVAIRGSEIVRQLMIYAGKESGVLGLVDISRTVEQMLALLKVSVSKRAALEIDLGGDLPAVRANAPQLRQIVLNLVTNASEAIGDRSGVIRVTTRRVAVSRDWPGLTSEDLAEGDYLQLEVSDTGRGIPPETQARMFDPFFTTKSAGHGLGLAVVQGIVRSLGGAIHIESEPDKGTTFQILLPCAETVAEAANGPASGAEEAERPSQEATILVVEDEDPLRRAVVKMLRKKGFSVIEAGDGSAALEAIRAHQRPIDVLLLDITLPGTPSREVLEEAKRLRTDMRVIVASAYTEDLAAASLQGRIERFLRKPYQLGDLVNLIRQSLF